MRTTPWAGLLLTGLLVSSSCVLAESVFGSLFGKSAHQKLYEAAEAGNSQQVQELLVAGAKPDGYKDGSHGSTALLISSEAGFTDVVYMLLESGAKPNRQNKDGASALMGAAAGGHHAAVDLLLRKGANPDLQDYNGGTALMFASDK